MTVKDFVELRAILDKLGIYYEEGNYYEYTAEEGEKICGLWLEIKETLFEVFEN